MLLTGALQTLLIPVTEDTIVRASRAVRYIDYCASPRSITDIELAFEYPGTDTLWIHIPRPYPLASGRIAAVIARRRRRIALLTRTDHTVPTALADVVNLVAVRRHRTWITRRHAATPLAFLDPIAEHTVARAGRSVRLVSQAAPACSVANVYLALRRPAADPLRIDIASGRPCATYRVATVVARRNRRVALLSLSVADHAIPAGRTQIVVLVTGAAHQGARIATAHTSSERVANLRPVAEVAVVRTSRVVGCEQASSCVTSVRRASHPVVAVAVQYTDPALSARLVANQALGRARISAAHTTVLGIAALRPVAEDAVVGAKRVVWGIKTLMRVGVACVRGAIDIVDAVLVLLAADGHGP